jgi:predicted transcriptional regulator
VTAFAWVVTALVHRQALPHDVHLYIVRRTQIYLDDDQTSRLDERAAAEGTTRSAVIRRAVEDYLTQEERATAAWHTRWKRAIQETAGIAPYLQEGVEYVDALRHKDAERLSELPVP